MEEEKTGHRDKDGNWVDETPQAKIRNSLGRFWFITEVLSNDDLFEHVGIDKLKEIAKECHDNKEKILKLLKETED